MSADELMMVNQEDWFSICPAALPSRTVRNPAALEGSEPPRLKTKGRKTSHHRCKNTVVVRIPREILLSFVTCAIAQSSWSVAEEIELSRDSLGVGRLASVS